MNGRRKGWANDPVLAAITLLWTIGFHVTLIIRMGMQLPGAWQSVQAQAAGGAPMSGQQMAAAAAVTQQGGMVASYPIQQFQVRHHSQRNVRFI